MSITSRQKSGFTLVELLVVIAIIALLMSILMPALARVRKQARGVICLSNLNQFGKCYAMYAGDWDGSTPRGWWQSGTTVTGAPLNPRDYWMHALEKYYGLDGDIRCCPSAMKLGSEAGFGPWGGGGNVAGFDATKWAWGEFTGTPGQPSVEWPECVMATHYGSYGWNSWICNVPADVEETQEHLTKYYWRTLTVKGTANIPLHIGNQWIGGWPEPTDDPPEYRGQPWSLCPGAHNVCMGRFCQDRHTGHVNMVFLDLSARPVGLKELWTLKWRREYNIEGPWTIAGFQGNRKACADAWDAAAPWMSDVPEY